MSVTAAGPQLNLTVRLRVGKSHGGADGQRAQRDAKHADNAATGVRGGGRFWGLGGGWQGRCPQRARLTSVPADRLSSPSRTSRGRDRRRLNLSVRPSHATLRSTDEFKRELPSRREG